MDKDRVFTSKDKDENDWVLKYIRPTQKVLNKGELVYRTSFSRALREGILTQAEVDNILRDRGIWDDEKESSAAAMRTVIADLEKKFVDPTLTNEQGKLVCSEITSKRVELIRHNNIYTQVADNTCETMANEARNQYFCAECIYDMKTGLRVYKDVEDFKDRLDESVALDAYRETVISSLEVLTGRELPSDLTSEYAENKWLSERGLVDGEEAEEESKPVKKKRRGRKKKSATKDAS